MDIASVTGIRVVHGRTLDGYGVRALQVGRTADEVRQDLGIGIEHGIRNGAGRDAVAFLEKGKFGGGKGSTVDAAFGEGGIPLGTFLGIFFGPCGERVVPGGLVGGKLLAAFRKKGIGFGGYVEILRGIEAERFLGFDDAFGTDGRAVGFRGSGYGSGTLADYRFEHDEGGPAVLFGMGNEFFHFGIVVHVALQHLPAVGVITLAYVLGEGHVGAAVDADAVFVVQHDQFSEFEVTRKARSLGRDAFHEASFADERIGVMVNDGTVGGVEPGGEHRFGDCHADCRGNTLTERTGSGLDTRGVAVFGMAGTAGTDLSEIADVIEGNRIAGEVQDRIQKHRTVACGKDEAVAVLPGGIDRIVPENFPVENGGEFGGSQRKPGMARIGFLDCIHREAADREGYRIK